MIAGWTTSSRAAEAVRFSKITVDVAPLRAKGVGPMADRVQELVGAALAREFAGAVVADRSAPVLVVRIDSIQLSTNLSSADRTHGANLTVTDYMQGEGVVVSGGRAVAQYPVLGAYENVLGPTVMYPQAFDRRLRDLSAFYAGWMRRKVGA